MRPSLLRRAAFPALLAAACGHNPPAAAPMPAPPPAPAPAPATPPPVDSNIQLPISTCIIRGGELTNVSINYNPTTGDTLVNGRPFAEVYPDTGSFAKNAEWYTTSGLITYREKRFVKYGLPRGLSSGDVIRDGEVQGVPVFAEPGVSWREIIYVPVDQRCSFQPYVIVSIK